MTIIFQYFATEPEYQYFRIYFRSHNNITDFLKYCLYKYGLQVFMKSANHVMYLTCDDIHTDCVYSENLAAVWQNAVFMTDCVAASAI